LDSFFAPQYVTGSSWTDIPTTQYPVKKKKRERARESGERARIVEGERGRGERKRGTTGDRRHTHRWTKREGERERERQYAICGHNFEIFKEAG
jgi:hypothetical protein